MHLDAGSPIETAGLIPASDQTACIAAIAGNYSLFIQRCILERTAKAAKP